MASIACSLNLLTHPHSHSRIPHPFADFKAQLLALHRELVANVLELVTVLVDKPSLWARQVGRWTGQGRSPAPGSCA